MSELLILFVGHLLAVIIPGLNLVLIVKIASEEKWINVLQAIFGLSLAVFIFSTLSLTTFQILTNNQIVINIVEKVGGIYILYTASKLLELKISETVDHLIIKTIEKIKRLLKIKSKNILKPKTKNHFINLFFLNLINVQMFMFILALLSSLHKQSIQIQISGLAIIVLQNIVWFAGCALVIKLIKNSNYKFKHTYLLNNIAGIFLIIVSGNFLF